MANKDWGADTPISLPVPPSKKNAAVVNFGGFGFGPRGMVHVFTTSDRDEIESSYYVTKGMPNG